MLLLTVLFSAVLPLSVRADSGKTLRLICEAGNTQVEWMHWSIYKVGERRGQEIILTGRFADYPVDLNNLTENTVGAAAKALESFVIGDALPADAQGDTDAEGIVEFYGLDAGIYLAVPQKAMAQEKMYISAPLLTELSEDGAAVLPKIYQTAILSGKSGRMSVKKIWLGDEGAEESRPVNVTVDLYKDTEYYDTVTLNDENNWEFRWEHLDENAEWYVVEREIPRDYTVLIGADSKQFLIQNLFRRPAVTTTTGISQTTVTTTVPAGSGTKLPQTGQSWQPVYFLAFGGIALILLGLYLKKRSHE